MNSINRKKNRRMKGFLRRRESLEIREELIMLKESHSELLKVHESVQKELNSIKFDKCKTNDKLWSIFLNHVASILTLLCLGANIYLIIQAQKQIEIASNIYRDSIRPRIQLSKYGNDFYHGIVDGHTITIPNCNVAIINKGVSETGQTFMLLSASVQNYNVCDEIRNYKPINVLNCAFNNLGVIPIEEDVRRNFTNTKIITESEINNKYFIHLYLLYTDNFGFAYDSYYKYEIRQTNNHWETFLALNETYTFNIKFKGWEINKKDITLNLKSE